MTIEATEIPDEAEGEATPTEPNGETPEQENPGEGKGQGEAEQPEIPEAYRTEGGEADIAKLIARATEADKAASDPDKAVPESAEAYELTLEGGELFGDQKFEIAPDDPLIQKFKETAHANGIPQKAAQELASLGMEAITENLKSAFTATSSQVEAEMAKLGDDGGQRIQNLITQIDGALGEGEGYALLSEVRSERTFLALESLMGKQAGGEAGRITHGQSAGGEGKTLADRMFSQS